MQHSENLEYWIGKIRDTAPVLDDSQHLTDNIMLKIHETEHHELPVIFIWIKRVSTLAAILLLVLFLIEEMTPSRPLSLGSINYIPVVIQCESSGYSSNVAGKNVTEILSELYLKRLKKKATSTRQINSFINHYDYENNN